MAEENREAQAVATPAPETVEEPKHSDGSGGMTFDQWLDSNPTYRSEFDRRMTKGVQTARANWEQEQADNQDEAKKLAKMTEAQRERYQLDKDKEAFARQQAQFAAEQMRVAALPSIWRAAPQRRARPTWRSSKLCGIGPSPPRYPAGCRGPGRRKHPGPRRGPLTRF